MLRCEELAIGNLRIVSQDAVDVLEQRLPPACLDEVLLYFPDPWPKKRHHKRRIVQEEFVTLVVSRLRSGGVFRLATDWQPYAEWMLEVLNAAPDLGNVAPGGGFIERPDRGETRFEDRGRRFKAEVGRLRAAGVAS